MKIYKLSQTDNRTYDTFDSAVVCAPDEESAREMHPRCEREDLWRIRANRKADCWEEYTWVDRTTCKEKDWASNTDVTYFGWACKPSLIQVEYLGEAKEGSVQCYICSSYNAG